MPRRSSHYKSRKSDSAGDVQLTVRDVHVCANDFKKIRCIFEDLASEPKKGLTRKEFNTGFNKISGDGVPQKSINQLFEIFDADNSGRIDLTEWTQHLGRTLNLAHGERKRRLKGDELFAATCKAILKVKQRKKLREELHGFSDSMLSFDEFKQVMKRLDKKYELKIQKDEYTTLFEYFDVDSTKNISLANLEHWIGEFEELGIVGKGTQKIDAVFRQSVDSIRRWKTGENEHLDKIRKKQRMNPVHRIFSDLLNFAAFGMLCEPITLLAYFLRVFAQTPKGEKLPDYSMTFFAGIFRAILTFGLWFMELKRAADERVPRWMNHSRVFLWFAALCFAILSTMIYTPAAYQDSVFNCHACSRCNRQDGMYYDPICYGDISAFAGQDDTCVCGIREEAQVDLDGPTRKGFCIVGWNCDSSPTCPDIYRTVTPFNTVGTNVTIRPAEGGGPHDGYLATAWNTDTWEYGVSIPDLNSVDTFDFDLSELLLVDGADTTVVRSKDCFYYEDGWFFSVGYWITCMCWISTALLTKVFLETAGKICCKKIKSRRRVSDSSDSYAE